jgi:hypothetical protein
MAREFRTHQPLSPPTPAQAPQPGKDRAQAGKSGAEEKKQKSETGPQEPAPARPKEIGGPSGPEPTRYGDWERKGICSDF